MSFEKWLENKGEVISDTCTEVLEDLYEAYVYDMREDDTKYVWSNLL